MSAVVFFMPGGFVIQNKLYVKIRLAAYAIVASLVSTLPAVVPAVDDDYFIPYTDTFGYVYDPQTGNYVKQDSPATDTASNTEQTSTTYTPADTSVEPANGISGPGSMQGEVSVESGSATRLTGINVVLPVLLLIAGVAGYLLITRKNKVQ